MSENEDLEVGSLYSIRGFSLRFGLVDMNAVVYGIVVSLDYNGTIGTMVLVNSKPEWFPVRYNKYFTKIS